MNIYKAFENEITESLIELINLSFSTDHFTNI